MEYLKWCSFVFLLLVLAISPEIRAQETITTVEPKAALDRLNEEAKQAYYASEYATALEKLQVGLNQARVLNDRQYISAFLTGIGIVYSALSQHETALEYYEQALAIAREIGDQHNEGGTLGNIGIVYTKLGQYPQALKNHEQALLIYREISDRRGEGGSLGNIGIVYDLLGQYPQALKNHKQALEISREIGDRHGEGCDLGNIGAMYENLGQYPRALEYFEQARKIMREIGDQRGEGTALKGISQVYAHLGQYSQALEQYEQAREIMREIGDPFGEGGVLNDIGVVYKDLGQYPQALENHKQALEIAREIGDRRGEGLALSNIGVVYKNLGQYQQALEFFEQALVIDREIGNRRGEGGSLGNIGVVYDILRQHQRALEQYEQALVIDREIGDRRGEVTALSNIGNVYKNLGQYQQAFITFQDSLNINKALGTLDGLWVAQRGLASVEVKLKRFESAIAYYENALDTIEALRIGLKETEHELPFMRDKFYVYDELIDLLQDLHKEHPEKDYDRQALDVFERKQARVFLEEMGKSGARLFAGIPEALLQRERDLEFQVEHTRKQLGDERAKIITEQNKAHLQSLEERENTLKTEQEELKKQMEKNYPDYYVLRYPTPITLKNLQEHVLQPDELLLVYHVLQDKTCLWVIGQETFTLYELPLREVVLDEKVDTFRETLQHEWNNRRGITGFPIPSEQRQRPTGQPRVSFTQISHDLYTELIPETVRPLLTDSQTVHIVPTGPLYGLPFEALVTALPKDSTLSSSEKETPHYLLEDIPVSYLSSASLLKILRNAQRDDAKYPLLAFAHPVYTPISDETKTASDRSFQALRTGAYLELHGGTFKELPETEEEVNEIKTILQAPDESVPLQLRENASRSNVFAFHKQGRLDEYRYLVLACHGLLPCKTTQVTQPALALSLPDPVTQKVEYLTMADVFGLQLNADLVTLSACNTGRGTQVKGEGVMGLTRAFMYAGTPRVAVTLWSVESFSAKELDIGFFRHLNDGRSPAEALQKIKVEMLSGLSGRQDDLYRHPYYWAPFVLFGDGSGQ